MTTVFEGVVPPVITPFDGDGRVDADAIRELAEFWSERVQGAFVCGTYGNGPLMTLEERKQVAAAFVAAFAGRIPVMVHAGAINTAHAVDLARHAESIGAQAVSAVPPYYYQHGRDNIRRYYAALVEAVSIPVFAYNNPKTTRNDIPPDLMAELADLGVAGMKDSTFDILYFYAAIRRVRQSGFQFIMGSEALVVPSFLAGARACVPGLGNCLPEPVVHLVDLCREKRWAEAMVQQQKVLALRDLMHVGPTHVVVQEILKMRGLRAGFPRDPFAPLDDDVRNKLRASLEEYEVL